MVKFAKSDDVGFERIAGAISELVEEAGIKATGTTWVENINRGSGRSA